MELTQAMKRLEIFAGQQMNDEIETAIRTVLAEMKRRTKATSEVEKLKQALALACDELAEVTGSCPYDKYNLPISCDDCHNQLSECWGKCFAEEADRLDKERKL